MAGSTAASCQAVMPSRCRWAWPRSMAASHSAWSGSGARSSTRALAASWRAPVGSPAASRSIRPRGGSGVARVIPASSRARLLTQALWPSVDSSMHRPVADDRVQGGPVRAGGAEGVHHPAAAQRPRRLGVVGGVAGHGGRVRLRLDLVQVALGQLQAAGGGVDVGVLEPGQDQPAVQAQHPGRRPAQPGQLALGAGGGDPAGRARPRRRPRGGPGRRCTPAPRR